MLEIAQGTAEWHAQRLGKVTASRLADVCAKTRTGYGASRASYMADLLIERLTGNPTECYVSPAMQWGTDNEEPARQLYAFTVDAEVEEAGFVGHPAIEMSGASPDGCVGDDGLIEIKCPNSATHVETLLNGTIADKYVQQMQWQMACTGRQWCDFVSFDPRMPSEMRLFVKRVYRDNERIAELESEVRKFLAELDAKLTELRATVDAKALAA